MHTVRVRSIAAGVLLFAVSAFSVFAKTPVLFLHGWSGDATIWDQPIKTEGGIRWLLTLNNGYRPEELRAINYWEDNDVKIETYAARVASEIISFCAERGSSQLDIVAHSMGGLVVREILRSHPDAASRIHRFITLGTPHYGQNQSVGNSAEQMTYGSEFLWKLAKAWQDGEGTILPANRVLCIVGDRGDGSDGLVNCWSAVLNGTKAVYVKRKHSTAIKHALYWDPAIYECPDRNDPVFRAISAFLETGSTTSAGTAGFIAAPSRGGAIFFQVVDPDGNPISYGGGVSGEIFQDFVDSISPRTGFEEHHGDWGYDLDDTCNSNLKGIGLITSSSGNTYDGLPAGTYKISFDSSKDGVAPAFTSPEIRVENNRTTVRQIVARCGVDVCFLIDSTGSMDSSIASVKSSASVMIRSFCQASGKGGDINRVAVVEYRDDCDSFVTRVRTSFTSNVDAAVSAVNGISVDGGGDIPEALYCAISRAVGGEAGSWRPAASKHIIVMTDAPPHDPDPVTGDTRRSITALLAGTASSLRAAKSTGGGLFHCHVVHVDSDAETAATLSSLATASGGTFQTGVSAYDAAFAVEKALSHAMLSEVDLAFACNGSIASWPSPVYLSASSAKTGAGSRTTFLKGESIYPHVSFANIGQEGLPATAFTIRHQLLSPLGEVLATWDYVETHAINAGSCRYWNAYAFPILKNLPVGDYVYRCELDSGNAVQETDNLNNSIMVPFRVATSFNGTEYRISFRANGANGTMASQTMTYGKAERLASLAFSRPGYLFLGWSKTSSGSPAFSNGASVKNLAVDGETIVLYAQWAKKKYKVAYSKNGGTLPKGRKMAAQTMTYGKAAKLRKNVFKAPKGRVFAGWATSKALAKKGRVAYTNAQKVSNLRKDGKTTTLYAVWAKKTYKVAFYANGGKGTMKEQTFTYGKAKKLSANKFKRKGYVFKGWAKSKALAKKGKVAYKNKKAVKNLVTTGKTVKLYAVWKRK